MSQSPAATAEVYANIGTSVVEQTFLERQTQANQQTHTLDRANVFADVLALGVKSQFAYQTPGDPPLKLSATTVGEQGQILQS